MSDVVRRVVIPRRWNNTAAGVFPDFTVEGVTIALHDDGTVTWEPPPSKEDPDE